MKDSSPALSGPAAASPIVLARARARCATCPSILRELKRMRNRGAWCRCDDCDRVVCVSLRGLDRAFRGALRGLATVRRRRMLADLDHLAKWRPSMSVKSTPASPIIGDGNVGGGAKLTSTDRPDQVNDNHEDLDRAHAIESHLRYAHTFARAETRMLRLVWVVAGIGQLVTGQLHKRPFPAAPTSGAERGVAVLEWLSGQCSAAQRKKLAESVGWTFVDLDQKAEWVKDLTTWRDRAKRHGTELLADAERVWFAVNPAVDVDAADPEVITEQIADAERTAMRTEEEEQ